MGRGWRIREQVLGPDDTDDPIAISSDGQYLLAVSRGQ